MIHIRPERPEDQATIHQLAVAAYGREDEAEVVDQLRQGPGGRPGPDRRGGRTGRRAHRFLDGDGQLHLRRLDRPRAGPHGRGPGPAGPGNRNRPGPGGLDECRKTGAEVVVVLGRPDYYPRFGFKPAKPLGVTWEIDVSEEAFMLAELQDGALAGRRGVVAITRPTTSSDISRIDGQFSRVLKNALLSEQGRPAKLCDLKSRAIWINWQYLLLPIYLEKVQGGLFQQPVRGQRRNIG